MLFCALTTESITFVVGKSQDGSGGVEVKFNNCQALKLCALTRQRESNLHNFDVKLNFLVHARLDASKKVL